MCRRCTTAVLVAFTTLCRQRARHSTVKFNKLTEQVREIDELVTIRADLESLCVNWKFSDSKCSLASDRGAEKEKENELNEKKRFKNSHFTSHSPHIAYPHVFSDLFHSYLIHIFLLLSSCFLSHLASKKHQQRSRAPSVCAFALADAFRY